MAQQKLHYLLAVEAWDLLAVSAVGARHSVSAGRGSNRCYCSFPDQMTCKKLPKNVNPNLTQHSSRLQQINQQGRANANLSRRLSAKLLQSLSNLHSIQKSIKTMGLAV